MNIRVLPVPVDGQIARGLCYWYEAPIPYAPGVNGAAPTAVLQVLESRLDFPTRSWIRSANEQYSRIPMHEYFVPDRQFAVSTATMCGLAVKAALDAAAEARVSPMEIIIPVSDRTYPVEGGYVFYMGQAIRIQ